MSFPPCQLCHNAPASCRAHIIPKQFYRRVRADAKHLYELHVEKELERRFTQSGIWEQGILCPDCDKRLGISDDYGYQVLPEALEQARVHRFRRDTSVYEIGIIDIERFRMFLVSLVWRAARSSHVMFKDVNLGVYEEMFHNILSGKDKASLNHVDCVIAHLMPPRYDKILIPPFRTRYDGVNVLHFYLYPWKLVIKLDQRPFGAAFAQTTLKHGKATYALMLTTFSTGELRLLADLQCKIKAYEGKRRART